MPNDTNNSTASQLKQQIDSAERQCRELDAAARAASQRALAARQRMNALKSLEADFRQLDAASAELARLESEGVLVIARAARRPAA